MGTGGIQGHPIVIDGRTGGTPGPATLAVSDLSSQLIVPYTAYSPRYIGNEAQAQTKTPRKTYARALTIRNLDVLNNLLVFVNDQPPFTIAQGEPRVEFEATVWRVVIGSQSFNGLGPEAAVNVATAAALPAYTQAGAGAGATLTASATGVLTVDGVATVLGDRILVKDGAAGADNGIYEVTTEGTAGVAFILTRATDHDTDAEVTSGDSVLVLGGTVNGGKGFQITTADPITVDTTAVTWEEMLTAYEIVATMAA